MARLALCPTPVIDALAYLIMRIFAGSMCNIHLRLNSGAK